LAQGASLRQYIGAVITFFNCPFISKSPFSQLSLSPNLYISFPISISLATSFSFPISISLAISSLPISLHYKEKHKIFMTGANNLLRLAYSWGHRLKIVVYLAERKCISIKDDN
jgi:hypothetical protein